MYKKFKIEGDVINKYYYQKERVNTFNIEPLRALIDRVSFRKKIVSLLSQELINFNEVRDLAFPTKDFDVFISHSHSDLMTAMNLKSFLEEEFGIESFVDSVYWQNYTDILREIDGLYAWKKDQGVYDYNIRNVTTANVHAILTNCLLQMINTTPMVVFIESDKSLSIENGSDEKYTSSPWIMNEIAFSNLLKPIAPEGYVRVMTETQSFAKGGVLPRFKYPTDFSGYVQFTDELMEEWLTIKGDGLPLHNLFNLIERHG